MKIGQANGADAFVLGTELYHVASPKVDERNRTFWNNLIDESRTHFSGLLTYDAQYPGYMSERDEVDFWHKLDFVGLSAYYNLAPSKSEPTVQDIVNYWKVYEAYDIKPFYQKVGKDIVFTEIGYRSVEDTHKDPWDPDRWGTYAPEDQVTLYEGLFQHWSNISYFKGVQLWNWYADPNAGGNGNTDYTVQNKPAQETITKWFSQSGSNPTPPSNLRFDTSAVVNPNNPLINQSVQLVVSIKPNSSLNNVIVDLEVYSQNGIRVHQEYFENKNLTADQNNNFSTQFVPSNAETYTLKTGVFKPGWSQNLNWNDNVKKISVSTTQQPPTPPTPEPPKPEEPTNPTPTYGNIETWWPIENATVSGLQPFKAKLSNTDLSKYKMYWQVDGDVLNEMSNSNVDAPHKESLVDVSGWNWKGAGPYKITFVAKDLMGNVLKSGDVKILIVR